MRRISIGMIVLGLMMAAPVRGGETPPAKPAGAATPVKKAAESTGAETAKKSETGKSETKLSPVEIELQQLRELLESQAQQLQAQSEQLKQQQEKMRALESQLNVTRANASLAATPVAGASTSAQPGENSITGLQAEVAALEKAVAAQEKKTSEPPTAIHIKGITLTPGGFFAAETVWRQQAASADVNTPFTGIPFPGNSLSRVSEFNASGRPSRITLLAEGKIEHAKFTGYYEADFLGAGVTSNNRQSNSYVFRHRQFWGQAALDGGWTFTGGHMWSLVTETRKGLQNRTEAVPLTIDHQYNVGFSWARQFGFRVVKNFNDNKLAVGFSVEGSQTTFGGRGLPLGTFFINAPAAGGGLFNSADTTGYTLNETPDFVFKGGLGSRMGPLRALRFSERISGSSLPLRRDRCCCDMPS